MTDLCRNCGHTLPNAAGPGLYCTECGEPVNRPITPKARAAVQQLLDCPPDGGLAVAGDALELLDALYELTEQLLDDDFSEHADELRLINSRRDAVVRRYSALRNQPTTRAGKPFDEERVDHASVSIIEDDIQENPVVRRARLRVYQDGVVELRVWRHPDQNLGCSLLRLRDRPTTVRLVPYE